jgi:molybdopterin-guanine dinucleotide biosynthesis protein A
MMSTIAGIFVGGASRRMGGRPKGLIEVDGVALVDRWRALFDAIGVPSVLVGANDAYAPRAAIQDEIPGVGPIGGLVALLRRAGTGRAIAVACDMPHVSPALVTRLVNAAPALAVAPRREGRWEPLFARYEGAALDVAARRAGEGSLSLQGLLDELGASELSLSDAEWGELADWDAPGDAIA